MIGIFNNLMEKMHFYIEILKKKIYKEVSPRYTRELETNTLCKLTKVFLLLQLFNDTMDEKL